MTPTDVAGAKAGGKADAPQLEILSGNEAIARGAWEAGVRFASAYPGTPSTEIMEALAKYDDVYAEWAPNEKVAVEAATGAVARRRSRPGAHEARGSQRRRRPVLLVLARWA